MKMPVGRTLEGAFGFVARNFLSVLGTVWFPYLVAAAILGGAVYLLHPDWNAMLGQTDSGPAAAMLKFQRFGHIFTLGWLVLLITTAMVRVGLMRKALGLHEGPVFIYFSLGAPVWRMLGAFVLLSLIIFAVVIAAIAGCAAVIGLSSSFLQPPLRVVVDVVAVLVAILAPIYTIVRFYFFLPAVVVAEERIGLGRAWALGGSNVLRIILVVLALTISVGFVFGIVSSFFIPSWPFPALGTTITPQDIAHWEINLIHTAGPALFVLWLLQAMVTAALMVGAMATAYRSVVPATPRETQGMHS